MDDRTNEEPFVIRVPNPMNWLPDDFKTHMRAAQREQLLAMRSLIDAALERIDEREKGSSKPRRVEIAVE
jgi:hypothetical protein